MSMSTHVIGFIPPDEKWKAMKAIYDACEAAGVNTPDEVARFFDHSAPDPRGVEMEIPASKWSDESRQGFEIELSKIPAAVTVIRFFNAF